MLTLRIRLISLQYDRASLEFHEVFGIPPAAKMGSAGDKDDGRGDSGGRAGQ
jgi:hypothetical protein